MAAAAVSVQSFADWSRSADQRLRRLSAAPAIEEALNQASQALRAAIARGAQPGWAERLREDLHVEEENPYDPDEDPYWSAGVPPALSRPKLEHSALSKFYGAEEYLGEIQGHDAEEVESGDIPGSSSPQASKAQFSSPSSWSTYATQGDIRTPQQQGGRDDAALRHDATFSTMNIEEQAALFRERHVASASTVAIGEEVTSFSGFRDQKAAGMSADYSEEHAAVQELVRRWTQGGIYVGSSVPLVLADGGGSDQVTESVDAPEIQMSVSATPEATPTGTCRYEVGSGEVQAFEYQGVREAQDEGCLDHTQEAADSLASKWQVQVTASDGEADRDDAAAPTSILFAGILFAEPVCAEDRTSGYHV